MSSIILNEEHIKKIDENLMNLRECPKINIGNIEVHSGAGEDHIKIQEDQVKLNEGAKINVGNIQSMNIKEENGYFHLEIKTIVDRGIKRVVDSNMLKGETIPSKESIIIHNAKNVQIEYDEFNKTYALTQFEGVAKSEYVKVGKDLWMKRHS